MKDTETRVVYLRVSPELHQALKERCRIYGINRACREVLEREFLPEPEQRDGE